MHAIPATCGMHGLITVRLRLAQNRVAVHCVNRARERGRCVTLVTAATPNGELRTRNAPLEGDRKTGNGPSGDSSRMVPMACPGFRDEERRCA